MKTPSAVSAPISDFIRAAVQEKAERELSRLDQQLVAFETLRDTRTSLDALLDVLSKGTAPVVAIATGGSAIGKFKKLRRAIEEAHVLAGELGVELEVDEGLAKVVGARGRIVSELEAVGGAGVVGAEAIAAE